MVGNKHQLMITIGAALSAGFNSVITGSTSKLRQLGSVIKTLEKQSFASGGAIERLKKHYNSLIATQNKQRDILTKRANYRSQIMDVVALGATLAAPIKSAMDFESAMADVRKVVDFSEPDGLKKMGDSLKELSRMIPISVDGLAQITAAGGQLGVKENELIPFTETVAKMSTAFDMLPSEAGDAMATLSNVFSIPITQLTSLGDAINHVSDNSAARAKMIVTALARVGGMAKGLGLSAEKSVSLVSSLIALGKAPEEAGTAAGAILRTLATVKESENGTTNLEQAFRKMGLSVRTFKKMMDKDAQGALLKFFNSAKKLKGTERIRALTDIFGRNYAPAVSQIVESLDTYKHQLDLLSKPENYAGSMEREFQNRAKTTENALQLFKNSINELSIELGNKLLPKITELTNKLSEFIHKASDWAKEFPILTSVATHLLGGLISLKIASLTLGYAWTFLHGAINKLILGFKYLRIALSLLKIGVKAFLGWPFALAIAAGVIYANWNTVQKYLMNIWAVVEPYWLKFKSVMDSLGVTKFVTEAWNNAKEFFISIFDEVVPHIEALVNKVAEAWGNLTEWFKSRLDDISPYIKGVIEELDKLGVVKPIVDAWKNAESLFIALWERVSTYYRELIGKLSEIEVIDAITAKWNNIKTYFDELWNNATEKFESFKQQLEDLNILESIQKTWNKVKNYFIGLFENIKKKWEEFKSMFTLSSFKFPKIGNLFGSASSKLPENATKVQALATTAGDRNQNNNFNITINGARSDDTESLSKKVMNKVTGFTKTFLFDNQTEAA